jgi:DNA-binding transcriptional ArsR family regulator
MSMESVFEIIAEPNRRAILSLLISSQQSIGEIERQLRMPRPTVSKHLTKENRNENQSDQRIRG